MNGIDVPADVTDWIRTVFADCNARITAKLGRNPNAPEESFDMTWIEHLTHLTSPFRVGSGWTVRIQTHYLGGMRHFRGWEIADVGVLMFIRDNTQVRTSQVALLQSKRLYPTNLAVAEEAQTDYQVGFARLADPEDLAHSIAFAARFEFNPSCRYGALVAHSEQTAAIADYEREVGLPSTTSSPTRSVCLTPLTCPFAVSDDTAGRRCWACGSIQQRAFTECCQCVRTESGPRTINSKISAVMAGPSTHSSLTSYLDVGKGHVFDSVNDEAIQTLFNRRSGLIAAAISITLEAPEPLD